MEEKNENYLLINDDIDLSNDKNIISDESQVLLPDKNKNGESLISTLERIKGELNKNRGNRISDSYKIYSENEEDNLNLKKNYIFWFMVIIIFPLFSIINVIGIFLIISIKDTLHKLFVSSLKCKLEIFCNIEDFKNQSNYFEFFRKESSKESLNFNLMMFWSFVGIKFLKSLGFIITSFIFLILNTIMILLIYVIDFEDFDPITIKYSYPKIIIIFLLWLFMGFTFGSSTLLSQQILTDYYSLLFSKKTSLTESEEIENIIEMQKRR